jgi:hypothetical protein
MGVVMLAVQQDALHATQATQVTMALQMILPMTFFTPAASIFLSDALIVVLAALGMPPGYMILNIPTRACISYLHPAG